MRSPAWCHSVPAPSEATVMLPSVQPVPTQHPHISSQPCPLWDTHTHAHTRTPLWEPPGSTELGLFPGSVPATPTWRDTGTQAQGTETLGPDQGKLWGWPRCFQMRGGGDSLPAFKPPAGSGTERPESSLAPHPHKSGCAASAESPKAKPCGARTWKAPATRAGTQGPWGGHRWSVGSPERSPCRGEPGRLFTTQNWGSGRRGALWGSRRWRAPAPATQTLFPPARGWGGGN